MAEQYNISVDLRFLDERSQRELAAYRKLGSLKELRVLKHEEFQRKQRRNRAFQFIDKFMAGALFVTCLVAIMCIAIVCS